MRTVDWKSKTAPVASAGPTTTTKAPPTTTAITSTTGTRTKIAMVPKIEVERTNHNFAATPNGFPGMDRTVNGHRRNQDRSQKFAVYGQDEEEAVFRNRNKDKSTVSVVPVISPPSKYGEEDGTDRRTSLGILPRSTKGRVIPTLAIDSEGTRSNSPTSPPVFHGKDRTVISHWNNQRSHKLAAQTQDEDSPVGPIPDDYERSVAPVITPPSQYCQVDHDDDLGLSGNRKPDTMRSDRISRRRHSNRFVVETSDLRSEQHAETEPLSVLKVARRRSIDDLMSPHPSKGNNRHPVDTDNLQGSQPKTTEVNQCEPVNGTPVQLSDSDPRSNELLKKAEKLLGRAIEAIRSAQDLPQESEPPLNDSEILRKILDDSTTHVGSKASPDSSSKSDHADRKHKRIDYNAEEYADYPDPSLYLSLVSAASLPKRNLSSTNNKSRSAVSFGTSEAEVVEPRTCQYNGSFSEYQDPALRWSFLSSESPSESYPSSTRMSKSGISGKTVLVEGEKNTSRHRAASWDRLEQELSPGTAKPPIPPTTTSSAVSIDPLKSKSDPSAVRDHSATNSFGSNKTVRKNPLPELVQPAPASVPYDGSLSPLTAGRSERSWKGSPGTPSTLGHEKRESSQSSENSYNGSSRDASPDGLFRTVGHDSVSTLSHVSNGLIVDLRHCRPLQLDGVDYLLLPAHVVQPRSILRDTRKIPQETSPQRPPEYQTEQDGTTKTVRFGGPNGKSVINDEPAPKSCLAMMFSRSKSTSQTKDEAERNQYDNYSYETQRRSNSSPKKNDSLRKPESPSSIFDFPAQRHVPILYEDTQSAEI